MPTLFEGRAAVLVGPGDEQDSFIPAGEGGAWSVPLPVLRISMRLVPSDATDEHGSSQAQILTPGVQGPQLTLLCADRPEGWPA
jgi:hypothetical protein